ncbi:MAG: hypothetical protein V4671_04350 [Armatimonadota bacterium]
MTRLLKIKARNCELHNLTSLIQSEGKRLAWRAFPMGETMEIVGDLSPLGTTAVEFGQQVDASDAGVALDWDSLNVLAEAIHQTIWGTFLGCKSNNSFAGLGAMFLDHYRYLDRATPEFYQTIDIGFQAVDSSFWLVYAKNEAVMECIGSAFEEVEGITVE